jgi:hypothetical protein
MPIDLSERIGLVRRKDRASAVTARPRRGERERQVLGCGASWSDLSRLGRGSPSSYTRRQRVPYPGDASSVRRVTYPRLVAGSIERIDTALARLRTDRRTLAILAVLVVVGVVLLEAGERSSDAHHPIWRAAHQLRL